MSPECLEKVNRLYEAGHTPCSARHQFMKDRRITYPDDVTFHKKKANRSVTHPEDEILIIYIASLQKRSSGVIRKACL